MLAFIGTLQLAAVTAGAFTCLWGLTQYWYCLWGVLRGRQDSDVFFRDKCTWEACWAMVCLTGLCFCFARAAVLHWINVPQRLGIVAFIAGMGLLIMTIGMTMWATKNKGKPDVKRVRISRMFWTMIVIIMAFTVVGLLPKG
jgi:hypothetical protein